MMAQLPRCKSITSRHRWIEIFYKSVVPEIFLVDIHRFATFTKNRELFSNNTTIRPVFQIA